MALRKSKITEIPMFPTEYWDGNLARNVSNGTLSHANYDGERRYRALYDENGNWIKHDTQPPVMVENKPFSDTLFYDGYYRGRSAAGARFKNAAGQRFTVFMTDLDTFIPLMDKGAITGTFIYCKRGMNYGVTLYTGP